MEISLSLVKPLQAKRFDPEIMDKVAGFRNTVEHGLDLYSWVWEQSQFKSPKLLSTCRF